MGPQQYYCPGGPASFNLIFANQFKNSLQEYLNGPNLNGPPNNNIVPGGPDPFNLMFPTNLNV